MERQEIRFESESEWLSLREKDITSTECAALFGVGAYTKTEFELHHIKTGSVKNTFTENERTKWGVRLEDAIAKGIAEDLGLIVEPFKVYMRIPELRLGSSFDYKIVGVVDRFDDENSARQMFREFGPGVLEVKNVDGLQFKRGWTDLGEGIEAPIHIEFQCQQQMLVSGLDWCLISPLVGGNKPVPIVRKKSKEVHDEIINRSSIFWGRIKNGEDPPVDYSKDLDVIKKIYTHTDGSEIDLTGHDRLFELCKTYKKYSAQETEACDKKKEAYAEILTIIKAAKKIAINGGSISASTTAASTRFYTKKAHEVVRISISEIKECDVHADVDAYRNMRINLKV